MLLGCGGHFSGDGRGQMAGDHLLQGVCGEVPDLGESIVPTLHLQKSSEIRP